MKNIWQKLAKNKKPFFVLAPMAGVTDFPFREIIAEIGKPDVFFTEFVSVEMLVRGYLNVEHQDTEIGSAGLPPVPISEEVRPQKSHNFPPILHFSKKQRPIVAQFFGCKPEQFEYCARLALELGFDGIDINMGCPDKKVLKQGSGSELIKNPELARKIIRAVKNVVGDKIPISIKTRLGYEEKDIRYWILDILKEGVDAITIHGRTVKQGYSGNADWEAIGEIAKEIRRAERLFGRKTIVIGNGDVKDIRSGTLLCAEYDLDGVMIGRQILKNPWVFCRGRKFSARTIKERFKTALKHTELFQKFYDSKANIGAMKKYYKAYLSGTELKKELMGCKNFDEAEKILMQKLNIKM